ncbi:hypothetical protein PABG_11115 [Paracoccidioides brasiliensis Pb03]|nr:hypothetical protein PABG_11115 [Paracoccidioides brasiliensis Pb03]
MQQNATGFLSMGNQNGWWRAGIHDAMPQMNASKQPDELAGGTKQVQRYKVMGSNIDKQEDKKYQEPFIQTQRRKWYGKRGMKQNDTKS